MANPREITDADVAVLCAIDDDVATIAEACDEAALAIKKVEHGRSDAQHATNVVELDRWLRGIQTRIAKTVALVAPIAKRVCVEAGPVDWKGAYLYTFHEWIGKTVADVVDDTLRFHDGTWSELEGSDEYGAEVVQKPTRRGALQVGVIGEAQHRQEQAEESARARAEVEKNERARYEELKRKYEGR